MFDRIRQWLDRRNHHQQIYHKNRLLLHMVRLGLAPYMVEIRPGSRVIIGCDVYGYSNISKKRY